MKCCFTLGAELSLLHPIHLTTWFIRLKITQAVCLMHQYEWFDKTDTCSSMSAVAPVNLHQKPAVLVRPWNQFMPVWQSNSSLSRTNEPLKLLVSFLWVGNMQHIIYLIYQQLIFSKPSNRLVAFWYYLPSWSSVCLFSPPHYSPPTLVSWSFLVYDNSVVKNVTFHVGLCWELETSCVGSLGIRLGGSCPWAGSCTWDCVSATAAKPHKHHCAYQCWSGSLPEPWGLEGCLGGAPNTWMAKVFRRVSGKMV